MLQQPRVIQYADDREHPATGVVSGEEIFPIEGFDSLNALVLAANDQRISARTLLEQSPRGKAVRYDDLIAQGRVRTPISHAEPARLHVAGTGLTHLGSAAARAKMHESTGNDTTLTDSMKLFRSGLEGGKPPVGELGATPEWFYKGNGDWVVGPYDDLNSPAFALDGGEEPEVVGVYMISRNGVPQRIGHTLGNEFTDHVLEKANYLYLGHSKLRQCSIGPELLLGDMPSHIVGRSKISRGKELIWDQEFLTGRDNMSHSIENIEAHHFKYTQFCRPGDIHLIFFGTATASFSKAIRLMDGDVMEISSEVFGRPLRNRLRVAPALPTLKIAAA